MTALHVAILCFLTLTLTQCSLSPEDPKVTTAADAYGTAELVQDIAHPRNIKIHYKDSMVLGPKNAWVGRLIYETSEDTHFMWDFLQAEMQKLGWVQLSAIRSKISILVFKRGNRVATVQLRERLIYGSHLTFDVAPGASTGTDASGGGLNDFTAAPSATPGQMMIQPLE